MRPSPEELKEAIDALIGEVGRSVQDDEYARSLLSTTQHLVNTLYLRLVDGPCVMRDSWLEVGELLSRFSVCISDHLRAAVEGELATAPPDWAVHEAGRTAYERRRRILSDVLEENSFRGRCSEELLGEVAAHLREHALRAATGAFIDPG